MKVIDRCREILANFVEPYGEIKTFGLNKGAKGYEVQPLDSLCGGRVTVSIEMIVPPPHVLMMGGGHCANSLAKTITSLNWNHSVTDSRQEYCDEISFPKATELLHSSVNNFSMVKHDSIKRFSDILLLGHDWSEDQERLLDYYDYVRKINRILMVLIFQELELSVVAASGKHFLKQQSMRESKANS